MGIAVDIALFFYGGEYMVFGSDLRGWWHVLVGNKDFMDGSEAFEVESLRIWVRVRVGVDAAFAELFMILTTVNFAEERHSEIVVGVEGLGGLLGAVFGVVVIHDTLVHVFWV